MGLVRGLLDRAGERPLGAEQGERRVLRGGCWYTHAEFCRASFRHHAAPTEISLLTGFRPARSAPLRKKTGVSHLTRRDWIASVQAPGLNARSEPQASEVCQAD